ncbi:hypothetical protein ZYGM_002295 [Zygosaccharomyces mellis]|uniref:RING-type domain-containing protein n=1 Tax=Zygosaccharomyces mellis TaxID=42258 RepID=A0A4C2E0R4_9SACH|nr:hypothetical protein ZYGM_002295 [Zygosaccharomyces mellis]
MLPMQNVVQTPTDKTTSDKKVHTPPSVEQNGRRPKLLKNLSGKVFRRTSLNSQRNTTLDSTELFNKIGNSMSMKRSTPKPLDLSEPLTPPPSVRGKGEKQRRQPLQQTPYQWHQWDISRCSTPCSLGPIKTVKVDSSTHLFSPPNIKSSKTGGVKPTNLRNSLRSASTSSSTGSRPIVWTETMEDPYLEEDSPTYLYNVSKNISSISSSAGRRRFVSELCSMCAESMNSVFPGETIVQMTCSHVSHYECYLAMYESHYREGKWPQCRTCHEVSKPVDEHVIHKMTSKLLTRMESTSSVIEQHLMNTRLPSSAGNTMFDFTPRDQLITSADISSDGFKTPLQIPRISTNYENDDTELSYESLFEDRIPVSASKITDVVLNEDQGRQNKNTNNGDDDDKQNLKIEINFLENSHYSIDAQILKNEHNKHCCNTNSELNQDVFQAKKILMLQVESFVKREVDPKDQFGSLSIFDQINYSTDGEHWNHNTLVCFFEKYLILFDLFEMKTIGKIPTNQVCLISRLSETTLIIDLKNRTLPEIYFAFPSHLTNHKSISEKWRYYLMQPEKKPELEFMSDTAWEIFPEDVVSTLKGIFGTDKQLTCNQCAKPWENDSHEVPLQLIVCLSLNRGRREDVVQSKQKLVSVLHNLLESLNNKDLLGIVTVGRNGNGECGEFGSFVGTVSKNWSGWREYINELETVNEPCFRTPLKEFNKVWETCYRLVSTTSSLSDNEDQTEFSKQIVLMTDDAGIQRQGGKNKFEEIIKKSYGFDVTRIQPPSASRISQGENISLIVSNLHQKRFKNLEVTLQGNMIFKFGNMAPGEKKTLFYCEQKKDSVRLFDHENNTSRIRIPYDARWFNLRTLTEEGIHRLAMCNNINRSIQNTHSRGS